MIARWRMPRELAFVSVSHIVLYWDCSHKERENVGISTIHHYVGSSSVTREWRKIAKPGTQQTSGYSQALHKIGRKPRPQKIRRKNFQKNKNQIYEFLRNKKSDGKPYEQEKPSVLTHACEPLNGRQVCASPQKPRQCENSSNAGSPHPARKKQRRIMKLGVTLRQSRVRTVQTERKGTHAGTQRRETYGKRQYANTIAESL